MSAGREGNAVGPSTISQITHGRSPALAAAPRANAPATRPAIFLTRGTPVGGLRDPTTHFRPARMPHSNLVPLLALDRNRGGRVPLRSMQARARLLVACLVAACGLAACAGRTPGAAADDASAGTSAATTEITLDMCCGDSAVGVALRIAADYRETAFATRTLEREAYWATVVPVARYAGFAVTSPAAAVRVVSVGTGADTVLVWSTVTAGRSTGSMAIADLLRWFANTRAEDRDDALRARLLDGLTILFVPMLGDADSARAAFDAWRASREFTVSIGFGDAVPVDGSADASADAAADTGRLPTVPVITMHAPSAGRNRQAATALAQAFLTELPGRVVRDTTRRFASGASLFATSGELPNDPAQQRLRAVHAAVLLTTLDALATGAYRDADPARFDRLPVAPRPTGSREEAPASGR